MKYFIQLFDTNHQPADYDTHFFGFFSLFTILPLEIIVTSFIIVFPYI